jgi:broad specificity phosphatase PhoE
MTIHLPKHPTVLHLIRHAEVEERYHNVFGGSEINMGLSPLGLRQASALAEATASWKLHAAYASPMLRVNQTLLPVLRPRDMTPVIMDGLREMHFGEWTGCRWDQVHEKFGVSAYDWLRVLEGEGIPGGESADALKARVAPCVEEILHRHAHQNVAVFCHGGIIRVILALLLDLPLHRMAHFNIDYAGVTTVEIQPEKPHAVELNLLNWCPWQASEQV